MNAFAWWLLAFGALAVSAALLVSSIVWRRISDWIYLRRHYHRWRPSWPAHHQDDADTQPRGRHVA